MMAPVRNKRDENKIIRMFFYNTNIHTHIYYTQSLKLILKFERKPGCFNLLEQYSIETLHIE